MAAGPVPGALAGDVRALEDLKREARANPQQAVKAAAAQFEQLFVQMLLKSMRDATPAHDPLGSPAGKMFQGMLDQQWSKTIAERGLGLAPLIERQLARNVRGATPPAAQDVAAPAQQPAKAQGFIDQMMGPARAAARVTGLPPAFILGQAALESGWGRHEIRRPDGSTSHNLFGIKAGAGWRGATVDTVTTEYVNGQARRSVERFRAYGSYEEAFRDYAQLLKGSPRYADALAAGADPARFAQALQRAGYATDPAYAEKLARVIRQAQTVVS